MLGPAVKLMRAFRPNFLLKTAWSSKKAFGPPKVVAAAMNAISDFFFAPAMSSFNVCASTFTRETRRQTMAIAIRRALYQRTRFSCVFAAFGIYLFQNLLELFD